MGVFEQISVLSEDLGFLRFRSNGSMVPGRTGIVRAKFADWYSRITLCFDRC